MARIPAGEGLGNAVARPALQNELQAPRGAFGGGGAIEEAGATVSAIGDAAAREQARADREAKMLRDAADRATASGKLLDAQDLLTQAHDEVSTGVATGTIDKTKAAEEWQRRAADVTASVAVGVPAAHAQDFGNGVKRASMKLGRALELTVAKRDRQDVTAGIGTTLEYAARLYAKDPAAARQVAGDTLAQLGPFSDLSPDQLQKLGQNWKEAATFTTAYSGINGARGDAKALQAWDKKLGTDEFADMDPQKKAQLLGASQGYQTHLEQQALARAQRGEIAAQRRERESSSAFSLLGDWARAGKAADPVANQALIAKLTPEHSAAYRAIAADVPARTAAAMLPLDAQQGQIDQLMQRRNTAGTSQGLEHEIARRQQVLGEARRDYEADPLRAAAERNVIDAVQPLDLSKGFDAPALALGMLQRVEQAKVVASRTGKPVSPLLREEAFKMGDMLGLLLPKQRSEAIAALSRAMPPEQSAALARQLDGKDKALALAIASGATATSEGRYTSEIILRGDAAKKDGTSTKGEKVPGVKASQWKANIAAQLADVFPGQTVTDNAVEGALLIAHGMAAEQGGDLSERNLRTAVNLAVGGSVVEHNGRKVALPPNVEIGALETRLKMITPDEVAQLAGGATVRAGGVDVPIAEFAKKLPGAELQFAGPGRYMVIVNGRPVLGAAGRPVFIPLQ